MNCPTLTVDRLESFVPLKASWEALVHSCLCDTIFLTWDWQSLWWRVSGEGELHLVTVRAEDELIGIAPLIRTKCSWEFAGGVEVADFLDIICHPAHAPSVAGAVLDYLERAGGPVELRNLRPDSVTATLLYNQACSRGIEASLEPEDVSPRIVLPPSWNAYLEMLTKKDRHELRRKLRRLEGAGKLWFGVVENPETREGDVDDFIRLHCLSAPDKASFMTSEMQRFFHALVDEFAPSGLLRLYFLELDGVRVAAVILFDYGNDFLLYNSGYDPSYSHLSVGLLLKALCLGDAITKGRRVFDFLQGDESYKYDLGAKDVPIFRLRLRMAE